MTEYIIFKQNDDPLDDNRDWAEIASGVKASSARRAVAAATATEGTYVAIPKRSLKPLTVTVEKTTKITIG